MNIDPQHCLKVKITKRTGEEVSPLEGLLVRGLWLDPGDVHHLVQDVQHGAEHCAPRREASRNNGLII
jgi:hypothetical protein